MRLYVDTREKWTQAGSRDRHIAEYLERHEIPWHLKKLDIGDYMLEGEPGISIDRKSGLDEVAMNLLNRSDSSRFWREVRRAHADGVELVVLVEVSSEIKTINDVPKWRSKYTQITGSAIVHEMIRLEMAYGVRWCFCSRRSTAKRIVEILSEKVAKNGVKLQERLF